VDSLLHASGVSGPLLVALLVVVLGWMTVSTILRAWEKLLEKIGAITSAGIDTHVRSMHSGDEAFRREMRDALRQITADIRAVHERIDEHLNADATRKGRSDRGL
jgi:hypothetical protein